MNTKNKSCILCIKNKDSAHQYGNYYICKSCIDIAYHLTMDIDTPPYNETEEAIYSFVFMLERDLNSTRLSLNSTKDLESIRPVLDEKLKLLDSISINLDDTDNIYNRLLDDVISRYKNTINLYL